MDTEYVAVPPFVCDYVSNILRHSGWDEAAKIFSGHTGRAHYAVGTGKPKVTTTRVFVVSSGGVTVASIERSES